MTQVESAWPTHPDYAITLTPVAGTARVWHGGLLLAESTRALLLAETAHVDRLYLPESDVRWEHFAASDRHTICPFKGEAGYWHLTTVEPAERDYVWTYRTPLAEVAGIAGHVCFYQERSRIEIEQTWDDHPDGGGTVNRFPVWGDAAELLRLIDVRLAAPRRFVGPPYAGVAERNVVEAGQLLAEGIVAASRSVPGQRVTSGYMTFAKAASFDAPLDIGVDVLRKGRSFSTAQVHVSQHDQLRAAGMFLLDAGGSSLFYAAASMPDVAGPEQSEPYDFGVTGRDVRVVDGAYSPDPHRVGPPVIHAWVRYRHAPADPVLNQALLAQSVSHWTIAAAMLPHDGFGEVDAHVTMSTGIMALSIAFHDEVAVDQWLLYSNPAIYAGNGQVQGEGHVFTAGGRLAASYTVQGMVRRFAGDLGARREDASTAM